LARDQCVNSIRSAFHIATAYNFAEIVKIICHDSTRCSRICGEGGLGKKKKLLNRVIDISKTSERKLAMVITPINNEKSLIVGFFGYLSLSNQ
jgi:hypothetical protein